MSITNYWPLAASVIAPNLGGMVNGYITRQNIDSWYKTLNKPSWTAPNWVFAPVWTSIYSSLGYASYLVIQDASAEELVLPMALYGSNLALNYAWSPIFFVAHNIKWAFYEILVLWGCTAALAPAFYKVNKTAGLLILPYLAWGTYATMLNYSVMKMNPAIEDEKNKPSTKSK